MHFLAAICIFTYTSSVALARVELTIKLIALTIEMVIVVAVYMGIFLKVVIELIALL